MRYKCLLLAVLFLIGSCSVMAQTNTETSDTLSVPISYSIQNDILITQPQDNFVTAASQISLLGAADPGYTLYMNGKEVDKTPNGYFAVYVDLKEGKNEFVFSSGSVKKTFVVMRKVSEAASSKQQETNKRTIFWDEKHIPYYGVVKRNYITHRMQPDESDELLTPLAKGTMAQIIGETKDYYQLSDQTFIFKDTVDLFEGRLEKNQVEDFIALPPAKENCFEFKLPMKRSCLYSLRTTPESITLTLNDTTIGKQPEAITNHLGVREVKAEQVGKDVVYTLFFSEHTCINGSYVYFEEANLVLGLKNTPEPEAGVGLKGRMIILDAGHGDTDFGAIGPLGRYGPNEKDINLQIMLYAKAYLEKQGASVITIRDDDTFVPLAERVDTILTRKPDLSISIHGNAMPITADFNKIRGFLTFYTYESIHPASELINKRIAEELGFEVKAPRKRNLALTRITNCPALLLESSFLSNPMDYEWLVSSDNQKLFGEAIGKAVCEYLLSLSKK